MFFDSHAHYNDERFNEDREELLNSMKKNNVTGIINAGYDIESSKFSIELSKKYDFIYASVGIHPGEVVRVGVPDDPINEIKNLAKNNKIIAIGEIGLDYHYCKGGCPQPPKEIQKEYFIKQIDLANELNLPIIIHNREADFDVVDIIKNKIRCKKAGVMHCSSLDIDLTKEVLELGYYISFARTNNI